MQFPKLNGLKKRHYLKNPQNSVQSFLSAQIKSYPSSLNSARNAATTPPPLFSTFLLTIPSQSPYTNNASVTLELRVTFPTTSTSSPLPNKMMFLPRKASTPFSPASTLLTKSHKFTGVSPLSLQLHI